MAWELPASPICQPSGRSSTRCSACRHNKWRHRTESPPATVSVSGKRNFEARDKTVKWPLGFSSTTYRDHAAARKPANSGLLAPFREISVRLRLRGGTGRDSNYVTRIAIDAGERLRRRGSTVGSAAGTVTPCRLVRGRLGRPSRETRLAPDQTLTLPVNVRFPQRSRAAGSRGGITAITKSASNSGKQCSRRRHGSDGMMPPPVRGIGERRKAVRGEGRVLPNSVAFGGTLSTKSIMIP
jgi:hypothetical protein